MSNEGKRKKEWWVLEYPGLGESMRNYGVTSEEGPFSTQCRNGALTNYWHVREVDPAYDAAVNRLVKAATMARSLLQHELVKEPDRTIFWELNDALQALDQTSKGESQ